MEKEKVLQVVAEQLGVNVEDLTVETSFKDDLNADSLDLFQIIMSLEEEFGIEIPNEDAEKILTIGDALRYVESKKGISGVE